MLGLVRSTFGDFVHKEAHRRPEMKAEMSDRVSFHATSWRMGIFLYTLPLRPDIMVWV
jgi:hypothetical protein